MSVAAKLSRVLMTSAAALALSGPAALTSGLTSGDHGLNIVRPAAAASIEISFFYDRLAPHGSWVDHPRYGYVFIPAVDPGWRPYVHGHWVYTDRHGWYWVSEEPFAWAVYHYGRWAYDPVYGWIWVPGNVWGPAWVTWRYGGGHVGWAPIGPHDDGYVYGTPDYYEPAIVEAWVFVPERRFVAVDVARYVTPVVEINVFLGKARERHHVRYGEGRVHNPFLPRDRVKTFVKQDIHVYNIAAVDDPEQASKKPRKGDKRSIQTFQAEISEEKPKEKPKKVASSPDEVKSKPKLKQTARGDKPEDAPPSAAELKAEDKSAAGADDSTKEKDGAKAEKAKAKAGDDRRDQAGREANEKAEGKGKSGADAEVKSKAKAEDKGRVEKRSRAERKDEPESGGKAEAGDRPGKDKATQPKKAEPKGRSRDRRQEKSEARPTQPQGESRGRPPARAAEDRRDEPPAQIQRRAQGGQSAPPGGPAGRPDRGGGPQGGQAKKGPDSPEKGKSN